MNHRERRGLPRLPQQWISVAQPETRQAASLHLILSRSEIGSQILNGAWGCGFRDFRGGQHSIQRVGQGDGKC